MLDFHKTHEFIIVVGGGGGGGGIYVLFYVLRECP